MGNDPTVGDLAEPLAVTLDVIDVLEDLGG
jgi:hypothetical protein